MRNLGLSLNHSLFKQDWFILAFICLFDLFFLLYCVNTLSISSYEALIFYDKNSAIAYIVRASCALFGQNDLALRLPMIIFHLISVILLYKLSKFYIKLKSDRIICVLIFMLFPGTLASALVVNNAGICVMMTLFILYFFHTENKILFYTLLFGVFFIDGSFLVLYLGLFVYAIYKKDPILAWICAVLFGFSLYFFGFDTKGRPSGHFIDTFGIFAAVFSPFVFIFFVYTIYRIWVKESKEILWFICVSAFCFCMIVSIRQRLELQDFLPFCIIATPLMVRTFFNSYRIRLPKFRKKYKIFTSLVVFSLVLNWTIIVFNHMLYKFIDEPRDHFAYKFHVAKELANELKKLGISAIYVDDLRLRNRLKFYGISSSNTKFLTQGSGINIKNFGKIVAGFDIKEIR